MPLPSNPRGYRTQSPDTDPDAERYLFRLSDLLARARSEAGLA